MEIPDAFKGARIVAVVTTPLDEKTLLKQMAKHLPAIALPKIFLVWETLPKMGSGKIDFRTISEMARDQLQHTLKKHLLKLLTAITPDPVKVLDKAGIVAALVATEAVPQVLMGFPVTVTHEYL